MMTAQILLLLVMPAIVLAQPRPPMRPISLEGCGRTKGCFAMPEGCHNGPRGHGDCDGIFTQEMEPGNHNNVRMELFGRKVAGWVAVGFNVNPHMPGTDVIACQSDEEGRVTVKNLHNFNYTNVMDDPNNIAPYLYDAEGVLHNGSIMCQFTRPLATADDKYDLKLDVPHHVLFAWNINGTAPAHGPLMHKHTSKPIIIPTLVTASEVFFNNVTEKMIDLTGCGKTKACSRAPQGCSSAEECYYVYTQEYNEESHSVTIESAAMVHGWLAMGYNSNYTMNGTDVIACQMTPFGDLVPVKKLHNVNHSNFIDSSHDSGIGLERAEGRYANERLYCRGTRSVRPIHGDEFSRDWGVKSYIILAANINATAPGDVALGHKHSYPPLILPNMYSAMDIFNLNGTKEGPPDYPLGYEPAPAKEEKTEQEEVESPLVIDLTGCGKTKGCSRAPAGCASAKECFYVFTQQGDEAAGTVRFEMAAFSEGWIAVGYNFNYSMNGNDVHACQLTPNKEQVIVKKTHNFNFTNVADSPDNIGLGLENVGGSYVDNKIYCSFTRTIKPITSDNTSRDLTVKAAIILAANFNGTAPANGPLMHKHNGYEPLGLPDVLNALDNTFNYNATEADAKRHQLTRTPGRSVV